MTTLLQDLRYGIRMLAKAPVVSTVAALSLALGIAANASVFAFLDAFLFEPLPYRDQDSLVLVREGRQGESVDDFGGTSVGNFHDYVEGVPSLSGLMTYTVAPANLTGLEAPEQVQAALGTPNLFEVLGVQPALGRSFRPEEGTEGVGRVIVLEHDFWERRLLSDPDVLGRTLTLDGSAYTVVGVMPEAFDMIPANVDVFLPTDFAAEREDRSSRGYISFGRIASGATPARVEGELGEVWRRIEAEYPEANRGREARIVKARDFFPGQTDRRLVMILAAVSLFGLLIACANVANLLLGRAEERGREIAVRTAIGAGRHRILRQLLTESVTLGLMAGAVGTGLTVLIIRWTQGWMPPEIPDSMIPRLDAGVLLATLAVSVLAGITFGLAPAVHAIRADLRDVLGEGSRGGTAGKGRGRLRGVLVVGEFALALALLTVAGVLVQSFRVLTEADPGFREEGVLTFVIAAREDRYPGEESLRVYEDALLTALAGVSGVRDVAAMSSLPRGRGNPTATYVVPGRPEPPQGERPSAGVQSVSPGYFSTLRIPVLQGRGIASTDREGSQPVVVVSQALAKREFPGEDPLGRALRLGNEEVPRTIVGVAGDVLQDRLRMAGRRGEAMYVPIAQKPRRTVGFALSVAGDPGSVAADVRRAVWSVDPDQPVAELQTLEAFIDESLAGPRAISGFLSAMGVIALLLAALGIYGVIAHAVAQRRREIGIRMALGATRGEVVGMITRRGLGLAGLGMLLGLPPAWLLYRFATNMLNVFEGNAGLALAGAVSLALAAVALLATYVPARRASGVQPVVALRE